MRITSRRSVRNARSSGGAERIPAARRLPWAAGLALGICLIAGSNACGKAGEDYSREVVQALDQGKVVGTKGSMETLSRAFSAFAIDRGGYPQALSLEDALRELVPSYLPAPIRTDAWGHPLACRSDGKSYTLTAPGQDGTIGTDDDLEMTDGRFTRVPKPRGS